MFPDRLTGYLVVPILFSFLEDRQLAGALAGRIFQTMNYFGLGVGMYLLMSVLLTSGNQALNKKFKVSWREWVLVLMLLVIAIAAFVLQPMMQELKAQGIAEGSAQAIQFGRLHGVSSSLFMLNSVLGMLLVVVGLRKKNGLGYSNAAV